MPSDSQQLLFHFLEEVEGHLYTLKQGLINLPSLVAEPSKLQEALRAAHSIKGGAGMLELHSIRLIAYQLESTFRILQSQPIPVDKKLQTLLFQCFDALFILVAELRGTFGLSEAMAQKTLATVQPVFDELNGHLSHLQTAPPVARYPSPSPPRGRFPLRRRVPLLKGVQQTLRRILHHLRQWLSR